MVVMTCTMLARLSLVQSRHYTHHSQNIKKKRLNVITHIVHGSIPHYEHIKSGEIF